jgi:hypothetical protein
MIGRFDTRWWHANESEVDTMTNQYNLDSSTIMAIDELIPWETNQSVALYAGVSVECVRERRAELRKHNRHDVDDEEIGTQDW